MTNTQTIELGTKPFHAVPELQPRAVDAALQQAMLEATDWKLPARIVLADDQLLTVLDSPEGPLMVYNVTAFKASGKYATGLEILLTAEEVQQLNYDHAELVRRGVARAQKYGINNEAVSHNLTYVLSGPYLVDHLLIPGSLR